MEGDWGTDARERSYSIVNPDPTQGTVKGGLTKEGLTQENIVKTKAGHGYKWGAILKISLRPRVEAYSFNPSSQRQRLEDLCELRTRLVCRPIKTTE